MRMATEKTHNPLQASCALSKFVLNARHHSLYSKRTASWRSGYAEDCKSLHPGSIPGEASNFPRYQ
jgi:hypothetical protein